MCKITILSSHALQEKMPIEPNITVLGQNEAAKNLKSSK
jgi:hypothetical protein